MFIFQLTETMRLSSSKAIQNLFTHQLSRTGNLTQPPLDVATAAEGAPDEKPITEGAPRRKSKWGAALIADKQQRAQVTAILNLHHTCNFACI